MKIFFLNQYKKLKKKKKLHINIYIIKLTFKKVFTIIKIKLIYQKSIYCIIIIFFIYIFIHY